jgi:mannose-1-phosphate guanylyltransferase/mannose-6-phosphate isomerase
MYGVIMAGGSGTRFWPLSRQKRPKQLLRVFGSQSLIQQTVRRLQPIVSMRNIYVVTTRECAKEIRKQLCGYGGSKESPRIVIEPAGRNTAAAIGLAAVLLKERDPDSIMAVFPSDHVIGEIDRFINILKDAELLAGMGYLVTLGIIPSGPETGYGYIEAGDECRQRLPCQGARPSKCRDKSAAVTKTVNSARIVKRFIEKPDLESARGYVRDGNFYWNSGMFVWKASVILEEIRKYLPGLHGALSRIGRAKGTLDRKKVIAEVYESLDSISIDQGIMERCSRAVVIPADISWSDVGSWKAVGELLRSDKNGNVIKGNAVTYQTSDSIIYGGKRLIAVLGVKNTVIVDTSDVTLICPRERCQDVKHLLEVLRGTDMSRYL